MDSLTDIQWMVKNDKVAFATATYKNEIIPKEKGEYINEAIIYCWRLIHLPFSRGMILNSLSVQHRD